MASSLARGRLLGRRFLRLSWRMLCSTPEGQPVLTLFTKKNEPCSLCDQAKSVLEKYQSQFIYEEKYIDDPADAEWFERYRYDIPVVHLNGQFLMKHRVNEELLRRSLDTLRTKQ